MVPIPTGYDEKQGRLLPSHHQTGKLALIAAVCMMLQVLGVPCPREMGVPCPREIVHAEQVLVVRRCHFPTRLLILLSLCG